MRYTLFTITEKIRTEADAYAFLEELRWSTGLPTCPHCDAVGADYIRPLNGRSRATSGRTGHSERRVWRCWTCRKQFSVLTGTVMHGSKASIRMWVLVIFEMCLSKNGVSAAEISRKYGVCQRTAWFMLHRVREAMRNDPVVGMMRGTIVADETFIGGAERNKHAHKRDHSGPGGGASPTSKTAVLTLIDAETGEARSRVVADVTGHTLRKAIAEQVDMANTTLYTDDAKAYDTFDWEFASHQSVNHSAGEYVRGSVTSNQAENFFSQLKRSLDGTQHHVSREHLPRYLAEFDYRYSTKDMTDTERMLDLVGQVGGRRLTYKRVTT